jgi:hypothetical protein
LTDKLDVIVRKVSKDPPRHRVTVIGTSVDIILFIHFATQELGATFKIVDTGVKLEKIKVSGQFKILKTAKHLHEADSSGEDDTSHFYSGTSSISVTSSEKDRRTASQEAYTRLINNPLLDTTKKFRFLSIANQDQLRTIYLVDMNNEDMRMYVQVFLEDRPILLSNMYT